MGVGFSKSVGAVIGCKRAGLEDVKGVCCWASHVIFKGVHVDMPRGGCDEVDSPNRVRSEDDGLPRWLICCGGADESDKDLLGTSSLVSSFDRFRCLKCSPWVHVWEGGGAL